MPQTPAYVHAPGDAIPYRPGSAVAAGDVVVVGVAPLVAAQDIAAGALGALDTGGVKRVPKVTGALAAGDKVFWNPTGNPVVGTAGTGAAGAAADGGYFMGVVTEAAASGDASVAVLLTALPAAGGAPRTVVNTSVAAAGSAQGDAAQVYEGFTVVTAGDATKGVILPTPVAGSRVEIKNGAAAVLKVYPKTGGVINGLAANAAISLAANVSAIFTATAAGQWYTTPLLPS